MKLYITQSILRTWDDECKCYRVTIQTPVACKTLEQANKELDFDYDLINKATCKGQLLFSHSFSTVGNGIRTYYYKSEDATYDLECSIYEQTI